MKDADTIIRESAALSAHTWLENAVRMIDQSMGSEGYAKAHPELVLGFMRAAAMAAHTAHLTGAIDAAVQRIAGVMERDE